MKIVQSSVYRLLMCLPGRLLAVGLLVGAASAASLAAAPPPRWATLTELSFQHLTQDQGLPNTIATAVTEDGDGFLWVATLGGLARWDGYHFRVYKATPGSAGSLPDNYVQALLGDDTGRLWLGTSGGGLARYDRLTDRFVTYPVGPKGLSHVSVYAIADDGAGGLWVGTGGGLDHLDVASGRFRRVAPEQFDRAHMVVHDRLGRLWVGTPRGLFMRAAGASRFEPVRLLPDGERQPDPQSLLLDSAGRVWVGTARNGAFMLPADGGPAHAVYETKPQAGLLPLQTLSVGTLVEARPGELWLGTTGHGVVVIDTASGQTRRLRNRATLPLSLADNVVRSLHRDRSGLVWAASDRGVSRYHPQQQAVLSAFGGVEAGQLGAEISWVQPMPDGRVWLGTHKSGVQIVDPAHGVVAQLRIDPERPEQGLPADQVLAMAHADDGWVYIGTKRGLYRASADGRQVGRVALSGRDPTASVWALLADGPVLWVGGQSDGLWRLALGAARIEPMARGATRLSDQRISVLARGAGGSVWVGTRFGLNHFNPASGRVQQVVPEAAQEDALPAGFVTTLHTDRQQRLWVGTYGGGLSLLQAEPGTDGRPRFRHITTGQGLPDDNVNALLEDGSGALWVSTDSGLARVDPQTLATRPLRRAEGVVFPTYWTASAGRTREGELLFGGAGGLTIVRPELVQPWAWRPATVVTDLLVGGRSLPVAAHLGQGARPVTVEAAANSLAVEFTALDYSAPERNRYSYRLLGYDPAWVEADAKHRVAAYTNLPPGRYTLQLRGSNRDGQWPEGALELPVRVLPAWHQTLWARAAVALAGLALLWAVVRQRTRYLRRQQVELERKVSERTAELERLSQALQEKSKVLELSAISDPLTGLRNRRFLTQHIDGVVGASLRRAGQPRGTGAAVDSDNVFLLIDLDHFKAVNDQHGHAAGDTVLVQFSRRLQQVMRDSDYLVRWGGEEFLAVARDTDRARAEDLAERIRAVVADTPFELDDGQALAVTCSIGFACLPFVPAAARALGWQDVVKLADTALFAAKRVGRNAWVGLHATESTQPAQLLQRLQVAPQQLVGSGELRVVSDHTPGAVVEALKAH